MTERRTWLPTTAYAVLGLLALGEEHTAYDLKQRADRSIAHIFWAPAMSAIYSELTRLSQLGLVSHRLEAETEVRSKRVYRINAAGRKELAGWVGEGSYEPTMVKNTTLLRVLFGGLVSPELLATRVAEHVEQARSALASLEVEARSIDASEVMAALVLEAAISTLRAEVKAADRLRSRLI